MLALIDKGETQEAHPGLPGALRDRGRRRRREMIGFRYSEAQADEF